MCYSAPSNTWDPPLDYVFRVLITDYGPLACWKEVMRYAVRRAHQVMLPRLQVVDGTTEQ